MDPEKMDAKMEADPGSPIHSVVKVPDTPTSTESREVVDAKAVWRKVDRKLLPILAVMYLFSFMDRGEYICFIVCSHFLIATSSEHWCVELSVNFRLEYEIETLAQEMPACKDSKSN